MYQKTVTLIISEYLLRMHTIWSRFMTSCSLLGGYVGFSSNLEIETLCSTPKVGNQSQNTQCHNSEDTLPPW